MNVKIYIAIALVGMMVSCEMRDYETGDGKYSYLHEDMVDVTVKGGTITKIVTDDGETLNIPEGKTLDVTPADTILRWMLYYNKVDEKSTVTLVGNKTVSVLTPVDRSKVREMKTDTLKVTSVWIGKSGKYLNMNLALWVGNATSEHDTQSIGIVRDRVSTVGKGRVYYTLYHDQGDVPVGYYTQDVYASVPMAAQDTVDVCIGNTHYVKVAYGESNK